MKLTLPRLIPHTWVSIVFYFHLTKKTLWFSDSTGFSRNHAITKNLNRRNVRSAATRNIKDMVAPFHSFHAHVHRQDATGPRTRHKHTRTPMIHKERRDSHRQRAVGGGSLSGAPIHTQAQHIPIIAKIRLDLQLTCTFLLALAWKTSIQSRTRNAINYLHYSNKRFIFNLHFLVL